MMKRWLKYASITLLAAGLAAGAARAETGYLTIGNREPVRSASGELWRAGDWGAETYAAEILFAFERAELDAGARKVLDALARKLLAMDVEVVALTAHADRLGEPAYNERLAGRRAEAVRAYLVGSGVSEKRVRIENQGARQPVTGLRCHAMGSEDRRNAALIACLEPDRRVEIAATGPEKPLR